VYTEMKKNRICRTTATGWHLIRAGVDSLQTQGVRRTAKRVWRYVREWKYNGRGWLRTPLYTDRELELQRTQSFEREIRFSILTPLYNTNETYLTEVIESVLAQTYDNWELCLADGSEDAFEKVGSICRQYAEKDTRIKYKKLPRNKGIAGNSNECIAMATGDYLCLLDHDDILHPAALHDVMQAICSQDADFLYTDELKYRNSYADDVRNVHLKPDFAPDTLLGNNYICHFTTFSRELLSECGGFREGYDGSQDHELILRLTSAAKKIVHIPEILYFWRMHEGSASEHSGNKPYASDAGVRAVSDYLQSRGIRAKVCPAMAGMTVYRVSYEISGQPKVTIIIPGRDHFRDLRACVRSVLEKSTYGNFEILIVDNKSKDPRVFAYYEKIAQKGAPVKVLHWDREFNWAGINNMAVHESTGEYLIFLNNDTEVITPGWIEELLMHAQRPEVGVVGALLYYPNDTVQHAGVILGLHGVAGHAFCKIPRGELGYMMKLRYAQNVSAVTGACMMTRRDVFERIGGFDEEFRVSLNDIDFCMRARREGYLVVMNPYAELYHYEGRSRGKNSSPKQKEIAAREENRFRTLWKRELEAGDPYYNPNFSLRKSYVLKDRKRE